MSSEKNILDEAIEKEIIDFYLLPSSGRQTSQKFNITEYMLYKILKKYTISKHSIEVVKQLREQENFIKYGATNPMQNKEVKAKMKQTCIDKYGVDNPSKLEEVKVKKKMTCVSNYGVEVPMQSSKIKEKYHNTCIDKYGTPNTGMYVKEKRDITMQEKYGVASALQLQEFKDKAKETTLKHYGVENPSQADEIKDKKIKTCQEHFDVDFPQQALIVHKKCQKSALSNLGRGRYKYNNETFDSKPELAFYIYHIDNNIEIIHEPCKLEYVFNNIKHFYFPDFLVNGEMIEIKGDHLYEKMLIENTVDNAKLLCAIQHNVKILKSNNYQIYIDYCVQKYGKNFDKAYKNIV